MSVFTSTPRGISQSDVSHAADSLLRAGERPTIEKVRARIGRGSPNTINPLLEAWWKTLSTRLDSGPAAFHRLPEVVAHVAEALWMQALEEARRRVRAEHKTTERQNADKEQTLEVRSHVLTLREGELDSRLRDRDRTIEQLNQRLRELTGALRKEQATNASLTRGLTWPASKAVTHRKPETRAPKARVNARKPKRTKRRAGVRRSITPRRMAVSKEIRSLRKRRR